MATEGNGDLPVPDLRTMEKLCQPSLNGGGGPIAAIAIKEMNFGLKNDMIQQVQNSFQFHGMSGDDANKHLDKFLHVTQSIKVNGITDDAFRLYLFPHSLTHYATAWFDRLPRNSINTFEQMAKMFLGKYLPPPMVTKLRNEITNFRQRPDESLFEAWEHYKLSTDRCPNHNMLPVTQIDTFYNGLTLRHHDTINAAAGGIFVKRRLEECYDLIENMTADHNDWGTSAQRSESSSSITSSSDMEIAPLKAKMAEINKNLMRVLQVNQQVKSVTPNYETCGGPYSFSDCLATVGNTQNVYATGAYQGNSYQPQGNRNLLSYHSNNYLGPPGFNQNQNRNNHNQNFQNQNRNQGNHNPQGNNQGRNQFFQGANQGQNPPPAYQAPAYQAPVYQAPEDLKGITTRSGNAYQGPTIPTTSSFLPPVVERETEVTKDTVHPTNNRSTEDVKPPVVLTESLILNSKPVVTPITEPIASPVSAPRPNQRPSIPYPSRLHDQKLCDKANDQREKFFQIFKDLNFNISFADVLILMPKFGLTIKTLLTKKDKLFELARTPLNEHCSTVLLKKMAECLALADLGASINLMPLSMWNKLSLLDLSPTCMTLELADRLISRPVRVAEDVFVKVGTFHFPADFVVVDFDVDPRVPLILERSFLKTGRDLIDVFEANYNDMTANRIDVIDMACEEYSQEVLGLSDVITSGNPIPYYDLIVSTTSPTLTPFGNSDFLLKEVDAFLALEDDPTSPKVDQSYVDTETNKSLIDEPPEVELKDLPPYLEYAFLEGDDKLPVIIAKDLSVEEKTTLIMEDFEPAVQHQRRVNPKIHNVIKNEVLKLLDAGLIYPISDSPWVSPVHCVSKKGGFTVVENEENELISTRLVTGWRVYIDYRKLSEATRKDHFPLPFMDQMLERLVGNQYYCFLDGFSGYFQITIDPKDKEKTTFTCPYGTFAHRRMPFGLCIVLGHKISRNRIEVDKAKVDFIAKLPHPITVKGIRSFLCHAGFYQRFIKDFLKIAKAMTRLLKKDTPFLFFKECVEAFQTLKIKLSKAPILIAPDWDLPFELMCDASDFAIGEVLRQSQEKHFRPIHYASKTMTEVESNYITTEKEMLAVVYAFEKFWSYLIMNKSNVYTDHFTLKYLFAKKHFKEKSHFMVKEGIVLGHKISRNGIEVDKAKVDFIAKLPHPTTVKGIRSFLSHVGFYRRFIKDFSKIAKSMTRLLKKDTSFLFSKECVEAFQTLKIKLSKAPILIAPDWDLPFDLMCDASDFAIGAVLGQRQEKHFRPIHYASNTMPEVESNYTTTEKEMLAVVYAFEKFRSYLIMNKSIMYTDHSALKYLFAKKDFKVRLLRWVLLLKEFTFKTLNLVSTRGNSSTPWFADFANYHAGNFVVKGMSSQQKRKFVKDVKHFSGTTPFFSKSVRIKSSEGVYKARKPLTFLRLATMDPPGDIMAQITQPRKCLIQDSIGPPFTVMPKI
nr:hypothetical protein [Tanacetum cinerariifolium]